MKPRVWLLLLMVASAACAPITHLGLLPSYTNVQQRGVYDCAIAALATFLNRKYEDVERAVTARGFNVEKQQGLSAGQIMTLADDLGVDLRLDASASPVTGTMIAIVAPQGQTWYHAVVIHQGIVYDPMEDAPVPWALKQATWASTFTYIVRKE